MSRMFSSTRSRYTSSAGEAISSTLATWYHSAGWSGVADDITVAIVWAVAHTRKGPARAVAGGLRPCIPARERLTSIPAAAAPGRVLRSRRAHRRCRRGQGVRARIDGPPGRRRAGRGRGPVRSVQRQLAGAHGVRRRHEPQHRLLGVTSGWCTRDPADGSIPRVMRRNRRNRSGRLELRPGRHILVLISTFLFIAASSARRRGPDGAATARAACREDRHAPGDGRRGADRSFLGGTATGGWLPPVHTGHRRCGLRADRGAGGLHRRHALHRGRVLRSRSFVHGHRGVPA